MPDSSYENDSTQFLSVSVWFAMWLFVVFNVVEYEVTVLIRTRSLIAFLRQNCSL